jgi:hypothetical protein
LRLTAEELPGYFHNGAAIGVLCGEPSGGLLDVDLDCAEALRLAPCFLPKTALRHGRPRRPLSHFWYVGDPLPETAKFRDPLKPEAEGMIVELRSTGTQTLVPPSLHPDGEAYVWQGEGQPTRVDGAELLGCVSRLAAAALLSRYWPGPGSRQDAALALAGGLLRAGWAEDSVSEFIEAVAMAAGDEEARKRATAGGFSARRLDADKPATGWPALAQLIGEKVADRVAEWLGVTWTEDETPIVFGKTAAPQWPKDAAPEAFYELAGDVVRALVPHTEADPHALLVSLLVAYGNAVGASPHFRVGATRHELRLFAVVVGETGQGRKGQSWSETRKLYELAAPEWAAGCIVGGLSSGEGLIWEARDPVTRREPIKEKGIVVDYQEVETDAGVADKRRLVVETELSRVLRAQARDGNILSTIVRQAWDSGDLRVMTKQSPVRATGAHISILAHCTKEDLQRYLDSTEAANGFGNRFIWQVARRSQFLPDGGAVPVAELSALAERLAEALDFGAAVGEMQRDAEAREVWHAVYPALSGGRPGMVGALLGRAEAQVMRLACCYALLDLSATVRAPHLLAALALWTRAEASVRYIFGDSTGDPIADTILRALRGQGPLDQTAIRDLFNRHVKAGRLALALDQLSESGLVRCDKAATGGRPTTTWTAL